MKAPPKVGDRVVINGKPHDMGRLLGLIMDGGVLSPEFQTYLMMLVIADQQKEMRVDVAAKRTAEAVAEHVITLTELGVYSKTAAVSSAADCFNLRERRVWTIMKEHGPKLEKLRAELASAVETSREGYGVASLIRAVEQSKKNKRTALDISEVQQNQSEYF
jgi:hypothetical protein